MNYEELRSRGWSQVDPDWYQIKIEVDWEAYFEAFMEAMAEHEAETEEKDDPDVLTITKSTGKIHVVLDEPETVTLEVFGEVKVDDLDALVKDLEGIGGSR
jgi:hypothetical protein